MYKINISGKSLSKLKATDFSSLGILERYDIQKWVENNPEVLGEDLLIVSKELILPTGSRLDLLALDKSGKLVVIELKRDDSGKSADWQAIKYASFVSSFLAEEICEHFSNYLKVTTQEAQTQIENYIEGDLESINQEQRIILVSASFHSDVVSAVLWLREFGIALECLRIRPFIDENDQLFIQPDKIIPLPEASDYIQKKERKRQETKTSRGDEFLGEPIESVEVKTNSGDYRIERYSNSTVRVFNLTEKTYVTAKPILREINEEKSLGINLLLETGRGKNTRTLGREVIRSLKDLEAQ